MPATRMAMASACSLARLLGRISPKISTSRVITTVETVGPHCWPTMATAITVPSEELAMFTILLPIRMVEMVLS